MCKVILVSPEKEPHTHAAAFKTFTRATSQEYYSYNRDKCGRRQDIVENTLGRRLESCMVVNSELEHE